MKTMKIKFLSLKLVIIITTIITTTTTRIVWADTADTSNIDIVDLSSYPLYPLRKDLGENLIAGEKESVERSVKATDILIKKRWQEDGFAGRGDHSKSHGCYPSKFKVLPNLPEEYRAGIGKKENQGKVFFSVARLSNQTTPDVPDIRAPSLGFVLKVFLDKDEKDPTLLPIHFSEEIKTQDFLTGSSQTFMMPNINAYANLFVNRSKGILGKILIALRHPIIVYERKIKPMFFDHTNSLVALERTFWSPAPYAWGDRAAKYRFTPCHDFNRSELGEDHVDKPNYQQDSIKKFLSEKSICYNLEVQLRPASHTDSVHHDKNFPIEDASIFWPTDQAKYHAVAQLTIQKETLPLLDEECESLSYNPWHGLKAHQPLGNLNRGRLSVYKQSFLSRKKLYSERLNYDGSYDIFKKYVLSFPLFNKYGDLIMQISKEREDLMKKNLFDTGLDTNNGEIDCDKVMAQPHRTAEGVCYFHGLQVDVGYGESKNTTYVGSNKARIGRNMRPPKDEELKSMEENLLSPNPRQISKELFTRKEGFIPATTINLLAAAWLQAQNHDWFSHGKNVATRPSKKNGGNQLSEEQKKMFDPILVPPVPGDDLFPHGMLAPRTRPDFSQTPQPGYFSTVPRKYSKHYDNDYKREYPRTFRNVVTHWWDASQIYGSDAQTILKVRTNPLTGELLPNGQIAVDKVHRRLYYDKNNRPITGFSDNWWVGLELFHSLFAMEHNAVTDRLSKAYPDMTDESLFNTARLVVSALIAKIHTIEWTPALLDNRALHVGMRANWYGLGEPIKFLNKEWLERVVRNLSDRFGHAIYGATGEGSLHLYDIPFSLTEEFVAVYRMHPLIPDDFIIYDHNDGQEAGRIPINDTRDEKAKELSYESSSSPLSLLYSLGVNHPGALTLHNFPKFMQNISVSNNTENKPTVSFDLAALDVLRDRERLVPRYNEFRRQLRLKPIQTFSDLTNNKEDVALLEKIYGGDVEKLDLLVGSLAENDRYERFAFGNTPFYIFALMASRRLMADPFYSDYFTPEFYTQVGYDWVQSETMINVIVRHYPELEEAFQGVANAFYPWSQPHTEELPTSPSEK